MENRQRWELSTTVPTSTAPPARPMPVLTNPQYERFAQERLKGLKAPDAYVAAGFRPNSGNAHRLNGRECIRQRIAELQEQAAAKIVRKAAVIDKGYVLQEAHRMYEASANAATGDDFDPKAANVASRFLDQLGKHVDVQAFKEQHDVNITLSIDAAISRLEEMNAMEGEYEVVDRRGVE
jgi:hypothetical protein